MAATHRHIEVPRLTDLIVICQDQRADNRKSLMSLVVVVLVLDDHFSCLSLYV